LNSFLRKEGESLVFPLSFENRIGLRDFTRVLVNGHLDEKNIVDPYLIAQDLSHPIHNGFSAYSSEGSSPFCQYPNQMGSVLFIAPVKFISGHIFSSIHSRVNMVERSQERRLSYENAAECPALCLPAPPSVY
jgi:hypothetical protein